MEVLLERENVADALELPFDNDGSYNDNSDENLFVPATPESSESDDSPLESIAPHPNEVILAETSSEGEAEEGPNFDDVILPESENSESSADDNAQRNLVMNFLNRIVPPVDIDHVSETSSEGELAGPMNSDEHDIIPESDQSDSDGNQYSPQNQATLNEVIIGETPESSESDSNENDRFVDDVHISETSSESQNDNRSSRSDSDIFMETDFSGSIAGDDASGDAAEHSSLDGDVITETDLSENDDNQSAENTLPNEIDFVIPESPNESDEEDNQIDPDLVDRVLQAPNSNPIPIELSAATTNLAIDEHNRMNIVTANEINENVVADSVANDELSVFQPISLNLTNDEIIPETESETSDRDSSEIFDMVELANRDTEEITNSPMFHEPEILFDVAVGPPLIDREDAPVPLNVENVLQNQNILELEDDMDDDETIMPVEARPIEISARSREIVEKIERFIGSSVNNLRNGRRLEVIVQNRRSWDNCFIENERFVLLPITHAQCRHIRSTSCLSVIFFLLGEIHELLLNNRRCTVRELYYNDINITQKQENVREALKSICCLLDAAPWELGVLSTSKGLIAGPLDIHLPENVVINCNIDRNGITLPHLTCGIVDLRTTATHILLVEKDTVFKKLLECNIMERWNQSCILITGKGYPDTNTRLILKKLQDLHSLPINVVADADPYGIEIMLTYRHGSMSMSNLAEALAVPSIRWMGIFPSDIRRFGIRAVPMTDEDNRKLDNILNRPFINDHVHRELLIMKQANVKAEIEAISGSSCTYLIDVYLRNKIDNNNGI